MYENMKEINSDRLFSKNFIFICIANFCMFFAFYMLLPVLPIYLLNEFHTSKDVVGVILSSYTLTTLIVRPFSGFMLDTMQRKPLYIISYFVFIAFFAGYLVAGSLFVIAIIRATHGLSYGAVTTASSTLAIDVVPSKHRGAGIGYFGATSTMAMALGPMVGLYFMEAGSFNLVFISGIVIGLIGLILVATIKIAPRPPVAKAPISLDRFFLHNAIKPALVLVLHSILYGIFLPYIAIFGQEAGITKSIGLFFTLYAIGLILSRFNAGRLIDRGYLIQIILIGKIVIIIAFVTLIFANNHYLFFGFAAILGFGFGISSPAYNTLFINLAPHSKRGTANSTYLISWDLGIGIGAYLGGVIAEHYSYHTAFKIGVIPSVIALILFWKIIIPFYNKNKILE